MFSALHARMLNLDMTINDVRVRGILCARNVNSGAFVGGLGIQRSCGLLLRYYIGLFSLLTASSLIQPRMQ